MLTFSRTDSPRNSRLIWNVRATPSLTRSAGDVAAGEQHAALARRQHAGEKIDERGLAGAVGADQRVARAGLKFEVDILHGPERAEIAAERLGFEARLTHVALRRAL